MRMYVFSVFDNAVKAYMTPFFSRAKGEAVRSFMEACNDEKHQFFRHANDFALYQIGEYDDSTGVIVCLPMPDRVITALECFSDRDRETDPDVEMGRRVGNGR